MKFSQNHNFFLVLAEFLHCIPLRIKEYATPFSWRGKTPDGEGVQIDLVIPATAERADYLCEMKFSEGRYALSNDDAEEFTRQVYAVKKLQNSQTEPFNLCCSCYLHWNK